MKLFILSLSLFAIILVVVQRARASAIHFRVAQSVRVRMLNLSAAIEDISLHTVNIQVAQLQAVTALPSIHPLQVRSGGFGLLAMLAAATICLVNLPVLYSGGGGGVRSWWLRLSRLGLGCSALYYSATGAECHLAGENPHIY